MSADNWTICPKCERKDHDEKEKALKKATESYGRVPADQYEHMIAEARKEFNEQIEESFREDYEIGLIGDEFAITYQGSCRNCKFTYSFSFQKQLEVK